MPSGATSTSERPDQQGWFPEAVTISAADKSGDLTNIDAIYDNDDAGERIRGLWSMVTANAWTNPTGEDMPVHVRGLPGGILEASRIRAGKVEETKTVTWDVGDGGLRHQESHLLIAVIENYSVDLTDRLYLTGNGDLIATENGHDLSLILMFGTDWIVQRSYRFRRLTGTGTQDEKNHP